MRLAIYAHYASSPQVAGHVLYYLEQLAAVGLQICFVSNSEISAASKTALKKISQRIIMRENAGLDFAMWQCGLAEYDLHQFEELLLTNSSIIGPLQPLGSLWQNPTVKDCDFWGLTDNCKYGHHLQSFFLVFKSQTIHSQRFNDFWRSVLPYSDKVQIVMSYELGLTRWLEEGGFKWKAIFPQSEIWPQVLKQRSLARKLYHLVRRRDLPPEDSTLYAYKILLERGMPFLKSHLLRRNWLELEPLASFELLKQFALPPTVMEELHADILKETAVAEKSYAGRK